MSALEHILETNERDDFCRILSEAAADIWKELELVAEGDCTYSTSLDEEAITSDLVRRLARRFSPSSKIIKNIRTFSKAEEAIRGADWEFAFRSGNRYVLWRFQAKRIHYVKGRPAYRFDDSSRTKPTEQSSRLIAFASIDHATPMYMFYNFFTPNMAKFGVKCHTDTNLPMSSFGISLSHASAVLAALEAQGRRFHYLDEENSIATLSCAMECLFCRNRNEVIPSDIDYFLSKFFNSKILNYYAKFGFRPSYTMSELPDHVQAVLDRSDDGEFLEENVFPAEFGGLRGIVLLDRNV